jgi:Domain of unknown function (DUF4105)
VAALAIYYSDLPGEPLRIGLAAAFALGTLVAFPFLPNRRRMLVDLAPCSRPSSSGGSRSSLPMNATGRPTSRFLPYATQDGDLVTPHNVRNFDYRAEQDFVPLYDNRTVDLRKLDAVDLIAVYWMGDAIAHIMVSFGFAGEHVAISIETRREKGEVYSSIAGFFKRHELIYVVGDECDLIRVRTRAGTDDARRLFLEYVERINRLKEQPEFYNTLTTNCTTDVWVLVRALSARFPLDWRVPLSGYSPDYTYALRSLDTSLPFAQLTALSLINDKALAADQAPDFCQRIREGPPRPPSRSAGEPAISVLPASPPGFARRE